MSLGGNGETGPTEQEIALADVGKKRYLDYQSRFKPLEKSFLKRTAATDFTRDQAAGGANVDVRMAARGGNATGNPFATTDRTNAAVSATGLAAGSASTAVDSSDLRARTKMAAFGQGLANNSVIGTANAARNATRSAISNAKNDYAIRQGLYNGAGIVAGAYTRKEYGNGG